MRWFANILLEIFGIRTGGRRSDVGVLDYPPIRGRLGYAHVVVITMIEEELEEVSLELGTSINLSGTGYYVKSMNAEAAWEVVVVQTVDRTNFPAGMLVRDVLEDFRPQFVLLVGIAGGLCDGNTPREAISLGDVVLVDYVNYGEFLKFEGQKVLLRHAAFDHPSLHVRQSVSQPIRHTFRLQQQIDSERFKSLEPAPACKIHIGEVLSMEKILGGEDNKFQDDIIARYDKALVVDTESMGIARGMCEGRRSFWYNPRYAIVRGISDIAGQANNNAIRGAWKRFAAHSAAVVAKEMIRRMPVERGISRLSNGASQ